MIEASQRMIAVNSQVEGEAKEGWGILRECFNLKTFATCELNCISSIENYSYGKKAERLITS
ncbi:MAG TPA: hypothetical protein VFQ47_09845 [Nitrososphaera sp.]|nr:hypothetical protein [Nitrososphaera sp.]